MLQKDDIWSIPNKVGMNIQETMDSFQALHYMNRVLVMHVEGSEVLSYLI